MKAKIKWYGNAAHLCVANWCRFHLATEVGQYIISTVGEYYPPHKSERDCPEKPSTVGLDRLYETYVFKVDGRCECGCGMPAHNGREIDVLAANTPLDATKGHMKMVAKYSKKK